MHDIGLDDVEDAGSDIGCWDCHLLGSLSYTLEEGSLFGCQGFCRKLEISWHLLLKNIDLLSCLQPVVGCTQRNRASLSNLPQELLHQKTSNVLGIGVVHILLKQPLHGTLEFALNLSAHLEHALYYLPQQPLNLRVLKVTRLQSQHHCTQFGWQALLGSTSLCRSNLQYSSNASTIVTILELSLCTCLNVNSDL